MRVYLYMYFFLLFRVCPCVRERGSERKREDRREIKREARRHEELGIEGWLMQRGMSEGCGVDFGRQY